MFYTLLVLFLSKATAQGWEQNILPVSEVKAGMTGIGRTVFSGQEVEEFGVTVLDIIKNFYPQTDVILVRLTGSRVEQTGVVSGMSGSPVYINGKLVGALALRFGEFPKEPIAGVMPIGYMLQVAEKEKAHLEESQAGFSANSSFLQNSLCGTGENFWPELIQSWSTRRTSGQNRIESPLIFSGFNEAVLAEASPWMRTLGFQLMAGGGSTAGVFQPNGRLEPGDAVSQVFISGDLGIDATGTVTAVDHNRILAFGHHIFNLGPTNLPMASSRILTTLPSLLGSSKMSTSLEIIGTMRQDRMAGVYGELGLPPPLIPVHVITDSPVEGRRQYHLQMADDPAVNNLLPLFLRIAVFQCMVTSRLAAIPSSVLIAGSIKLADGNDVAFQDLFSCEQRLGFMGAGSEVADASDLMANVLGVLWVNNFNPPAVKEITLEAKLIPGERYARIRRVSQDRAEVKPGDSAKVAIELSRRDGQTMTVRQSLSLPKTIESRSITVLIGSGNTLTMFELQSNPDKFRPKNFNDLLKILKDRRRNDRLYIQWRASSPGMIINGEELGALPPSVLGVMNHRSSGEDRLLRERVLLEQEVPMDMEISGFRRLVFRIARTNPAAVKEEPIMEPAVEW